METNRTQTNVLIALTETEYDTRVQIYLSTGGDKLSRVESIDFV